MPAIIPREHYARWLDPALHDPAQIQPMIGSYPANEMQAVPISSRINNARNQGAELIEPAGAPLD
jgi:putative SOS response-associated peptidase YedK